MAIFLFLLQYAIETGKRIRNDRQATRGHIKVEMAITSTDYYCISVVYLSTCLF